MDRIPDPQLALAARPLPSMAPTPLVDWLVVNEDYRAQLAEKARLVTDAPDRVMRILPGAEPAVAEFAEVLIAALEDHPGFAVGEDEIRCPDGRSVRRAQPDGLHLAARTVQEDICILEKRGAEHVLTAALLAFPASWSLAEKIGRPLTAIHAPVAPYDEGIATRVQRMFDALPPGRVLSRANALGYDDPALFQPRSEHARRDRPGARPAWLRSERQTIRKLPDTGAVVFTILTSVVPYAANPSRSTVSTELE